MASIHNGATCEVCARKFGITTKAVSRGSILKIGYTKWGYLPMTLCTFHDWLEDKRAGASSTFSDRLDFVKACLLAGKFRDPENAQELLDAVPPPHIVALEML